LSGVGGEALDAPGDDRQYCRGALCQVEFKVLGPNHLPCEIDSGEPGVPATEVDAHHDASVLVQGEPPRPPAPARLALSRLAEVPGALQCLDLQ
jgi:hypothetical protein